MANASLRLFLDAQLSLDGRRIPLHAATHGEEETLLFTVSTDDARWLAEHAGRMGIAQTSRGVVLMRLQLVSVDPTACRITTRPSDRARAGRVAVCAVGRLSAHRRR